MRRGVKSVLLSLLALGSLATMSGCGNLSSNVISEPQAISWTDTSPGALPKIVERIALPMIENGTNIGLVVGVFDGEDTTIQGYGRTSLTSDATPDGNTIFAIGSVTKGFLSLLAYQLVQDAVLSLSDELGDLLPADVELSAAAKKITVGQLLTHSSGLPRQPNDPEMLESLIHYTFTGENIYRHIDSKKVFETLREFKPARDEVNVYRYSNIGSGLLGKVIEAKTGTPLETLLDERILRQIGVKDTAYHLTVEQSSRLAVGHVGDSPLFLPRNTPMQQWDMGDILSGASGLYSTAHDLLALARYRLSLGEGVVDTLPIVTGLLSVSSKAAQKSSYGWAIDDFDDPPARIIFQNGIISGYTAYIGIEPDKKIGVVVLTNNFNWDDHVGHSLLLTLAKRKAVQELTAERSSIERLHGEAVGLR